MKPVTAPVELPAGWPSQAAPPIAAAYDGESLIAVQDNHLTWHLAMNGPGLLCSTVADDIAFYTLSWTYDTNLVNCPSCLQASTQRSPDRWVTL